MTTLRNPPDPKAERIAAMLRAAGADEAARAYLERRGVREIIAKEAEKGERDDPP